MWGTSFCHFTPPKFKLPQAISPPSPPQVALTHLTITTLRKPQSHPQIRPHTPFKMGWFNGWFGGSADNSSSDPLAHLDPKLREFLQKEAPVKYTPSSESSPPTPAVPPHRQLDQKSQDDQTAASQSTVPPRIPLPRRPLRPPLENLHPPIHHRSSNQNRPRKTHGRPRLVQRPQSRHRPRALENCADEQFTWATSLLQQPIPSFESVGVLNTYGRSAEEDEMIQMRADELYHQMLRQEEEIKRAKEEGREAPEFRSVLEEVAKVRQRQQETAGEAVGKVNIPPPPAELIASWKEKLEKLPEQDRAAEEAALRADYRANAEMAASIQGLWQEQAKQREERKKKGEETFMDRFRGMVAVGKVTEKKEDNNK
ncbi:uncharacterized protein PODANS_1_6670 [Podospora anserina S mat+]|uniref:Podospora anserina S mat+ genomic DNA chromosome 1, supercontig 1 n=1 Tax=Podospora anserina (strain S / ATCC MYA-4624 / DSM 980 / FGSC 10383) TaxID=515849 RepID=B2ABA5_PODAN|nr:uncharacterized protein PODANS_1_6670 [Podospora anserina S mat+]CAP60367.1 unnamed protein product [Podospora anserina S mat+]